ncbi:MAG TPA: sugar transferase, partial [Clostridiaceae bacterium]|nr:sugar transferase [Clostridiaceae bacterium]
MASNLQQVPALHPDIKPYYERIRLEAVSFTPTKSQRIYMVFKRLGDILISLLAIILLLPLFLIIAIAIRIDSPGPVIFRQKRVGKDGKLFTIYKFRTMATSAPKEMSTADFKDAQDSKNYITKVGGFLRRTSLDELSQVFNVFKGDMSLIGHRPLIPAEKEIDRFRRDNNIYYLRPGMTGLAQVSGRDDITLTQKMLLDREYLHQVSAF